MPRVRIIASDSSGAQRSDPRRNTPCGGDVMLGGLVGPVLNGPTPDATPAVEVTLYPGDSSVRILAVFLIGDLVVQGYSIVR